MKQGDNDVRLTVLFRTTSEKLYVEDLGFASWKNFYKDNIHVSMQIHEDTNMYICLCAWHQNEINIMEDDTFFAK